jgi:hypothetical protein
VTEIGDPVRKWESDPLQVPVPGPDEPVPAWEPEPDEPMLPPVRTPVTAPVPA